MSGPNYAQLVLDRLNTECPGLDADLALLAMTRGVDTTLEDVHDAWAIYRNVTKPDHKSLIPFDQLTPEVQELDRPFMEAIHKAAV